MQPIILESVTRTFDGRKVLDGLTARAEEGRVIGLLGRNGEGKSTLFKILLDMLAADSGRVEVLGLAPDGSGRIRQKVGYVPERPAFHAFMNVGQALDLRRRVYAGWDAARSAALCRRLSLDPSTRLDAASKGTLAKLAWVCAAAHEPALYLLDEPTSGLDALVREEVLSGLVGELSEAGKTVLVANHRMDELAGMLDEVWLLAEGRVAAVHRLDDLRSQARVVRGRLKAGAAAPQAPGVVALGADGPLHSWAAFDAAGRERLLAAGALEQAVEEPLPADQALSHLLRLHGGAR